MNYKSIIFLIVFCVFISACNKTSNKITSYINDNCDFKKNDVFFRVIDSTYRTSPADFIDLKKALKVDYDTLYLISVGFESDISDIIGFKYNGGDFTIEAEDKNLLLLVKNHEVVYQDKIKKMSEKVHFMYALEENPSLFCLLKHCSSIYKVERERDGLQYFYYLYNVNENCNFKKLKY